MILVLATASAAWLGAETFGFSYLDLMHVARASTGREDVMMLGNSVIQGLSKCDTDRRSIAEMMATQSSYTVLDLSRGGMQLDQQLAMVQASSVVGRTSKVVVFPISVADQLLKARPPEVGRNAWLLRIKGEDRRASVQSVPEVYKGIRYGRYADYSAKYFVDEKSASTCPETAVQHPDFVEFMYWLNYVRHNDFSSGQLEWGQQLVALRQEGRRVVVAIMPYDRAMITGYFGAQQVSRIDSEIAKVAAYLRGAGLELLDMSNSADASDFTDIWCACGHLNQQGRAKVASQLAQRIAGVGTPG